MVSLEIFHSHNPSQRFHTNKELMDAANNWLHNLAAPFFEEGLQKLVSR
jgi:hypothetical protein